MIKPSNPNAPATEKQIDYIRTLLGDRQREEVTRQINRLASDLRDAQAIEFDASRDRMTALAQRAIDASKEVQALFASVQIPGDMTQARASRWIDLLKNHNLTILDKMLDDPRIAAGLGVVVTEDLYKRYSK